MAYFALTMQHGPHWDDARPIRAQDAWDAHAAFMDGLVDDGFIILGGPIGDGHQTMLVVEAPDETTVRATLADDPWEPTGVLRIGVILPWTIWLDGRKATTT